MRPVSSWGRLSAHAHDVVSVTHAGQVSGRQGANKPAVAHGNGRSYGDVGLNADGLLWNMRALDRLISFDPTRGRLVCDAGVLLSDIQNVMIPQGWILPVTPGTQFVTVGGAIANDVHGKNHHAVGSFGDHVLHLVLARTDGEIIECGPDIRSEWLKATVGGLGLTGVILRAELQLRPLKSPWLATETIPYGNLREFFDLADGSETDWEHTVSWIDCLTGKNGSRGLFMRANWTDNVDRALPEARPRTMPLVPPVSLVNGLTLRPFNTAYYHLKKAKAGHDIAHYQSFFYPLDNLLEWNRMYGPRGFYQYQSVVPREAGEAATTEMLKAITSAGEGSFLAVLKTFGDRLPVGMLSFPQPGVTLALDFPNKGEKTLKLMQRLDSIVAEARGRIYPAKDARMPRELFEAGYPELPAFLKFRDPGISSGFSRRIMGS